MSNTRKIRHQCEGENSDQNLYRIEWYYPDEAEYTAFIFAKDRITAESIFRSYMADQFGYEESSVTYADVELIDADPNAVLQLFVDYDH